MYVREWSTIRQEVCVKGFLLIKKGASELNGHLDKTHLEKVLLSHNNGSVGLVTNSHAFLCCIVLFDRPRLVSGVLKHRFLQSLCCFRITALPALSLGCWFLCGACVTLSESSLESEMRPVLYFSPPAPVNCQLYSRELIRRARNTSLLSHWSGFISCWVWGDSCMWLTCLPTCHLWLENIQQTFYKVQTSSI